MRREIVVARYREDLIWTEPFQSQCTIYDKSELPVGPADFYRVILRSNTGREAETYLYHIINQYDRLADTTFFVQGNPLPHLEPKRLEQLLRLRYDRFTWIGQHWAVEDEHGYPSFPDSRIGELYHLIFRHPPPLLFTFVAGACFAVPRDVVLARPRDFYERALQICQSEFPEVWPWYIERFWDRIFTDPWEAVA